MAKTIETEYWEKTISDKAWDDFASKLPRMTPVHPSEYGGDVEPLLPYLWRKLTSWWGNHG